MERSGKAEEAGASRAAAVIAIALFTADWVDIAW